MCFCFFIMFQWQGSLRNRVYCESVAILSLVKNKANPCKYSDFNVEVFLGMLVDFYAFIS